METLCEYNYVDGCNSRNVPGSLRQALQCLFKRMMFGSAINLSLVHKGVGQRIMVVWPQFARGSAAENCRTHIHMRFDISDI